jgi:histidinol phosphatase-like enzyme
MVVLNKSITINGASVINDGEKDVQVAYMNASIQTDGNLSINKAIQNSEMFDSNKDDVLKDFAAFEEFVYKELEESKTSEN